MANIKVKTKKTVRYSDVNPDTVYDVYHRPFNEDGELKHEIHTIDGVLIDVRDIYKKFGLTKPPLEL